MTDLPETGLTVRVKGYFNFKDVLGGTGECIVCLRHPTVWGVLECLMEKHGSAFRGELLKPVTGQLNPNVQILINGRHIRHFPDGLHTPLGENDLVSIFPTVAGG